MIHWKVSTPSYVAKKWKPRAIRIILIAWVTDELSTRYILQFDRSTGFWRKRETYLDDIFSQWLQSKNDWSLIFPGVRSSETQAERDDRTDDAVGSHRCVRSHGEEGVDEHAESTDNRV